MSVFALKIIAIITMLTDHIGYVFFPEIQFFRFIGRTAFPIYAFLIAQGLLHTKNKYNYSKKILIVALLTEIPFDLLFYNSIIYIKYQNVLFTLFFAILSIILYEKLKLQNKDPFFSLLIGIFGSLILQSDYNLIGILLIYLFYFICKKNNDYDINKIQVILIMIFFAISEILSQGLFYYKGIFEFIKNYGFIYIGLIIPTILISMYNTKLGKKNKILNTIFYSFYPLHIIILMFVRILIDLNN